jgi:hypothetical protein
VPWLHMIGRRPAMMTLTVMAFGRIRNTAPSDRVEVVRRVSPAAPCVLEIDEHHHTEFAATPARHETHGGRIETSWPRT